MKKMLFALLLFALPALAQTADSTCTVATTVGAASVQVAAATLPSLRHYLLVQNTGAVDVYCAVATNNAATTTNGLRVPANGGNWEMVPFMNPNGVIANLPVGDVSCITAGGSTTVITCQW